MAAPQPQLPRVELPVELATEVLLRLPTSDPACLLRFSLVCKTWAAAVSERTFRSRLQLVHGTPPVLGFLHNGEDEELPRFIPATTSPFTLAAPDCRYWRALDCRHDRALFLSRGQDELLLWEPITGFKQRVPVPAAFQVDYGAEKGSPTAAVFCTAADPCKHEMCHGGPFCIVFIFSVQVVPGDDDDDDDQYVTRVCFYSSESGTWGETSLVQGMDLMSFTLYSSVLIGSSHLYFMGDCGLIIECDLVARNLSMIMPPTEYNRPRYVGRFCIMAVKERELGMCQYVGRSLKPWTREMSDNNAVKWVLSQDIDLVQFHQILPVRTLLDAGSRVRLLGFAEGANILFFNTFAGICTFELKSQKVAYVCKKPHSFSLISVVSFYTPMPRLPVPPLPRLSEEAGPSGSNVEDAAPTSEEADS